MVDMQMIERAWGVTAFGTATVKALPDLVRIRLRVVRMEQTPSAVFDAATEAVQRVRATLREHGVASVEESRLTLKSSWSWANQARNFLGYECEASFAIESTDLDGARQLLVDLVGAGANEVDGVDFDVRAKRELRAEARRKAVVAAREKAELYAEAAGVRLGAVLHIEDANPDQLTPAYRGHSSPPVGGLTEERDLAPGHIVVQAAVTLGFAISRD